MRAVDLRGRVCREARSTVQRAVHNVGRCQLRLELPIHLLYDVFYQSAQLQLHERLQAALPGGVQLVLHLSLLNRRLLIGLGFDGLSIVLQRLLR